MAETDPSSSNGNDGLPPYSYVSGRHPHPLSDPAGHSYGQEEVELLSDSDPAARRQFEYGVRLFNAGFYWESHEAWEAIWRVAKSTANRRRLQALIKLAAAAVKGREMREVGVSRHLNRGAELLAQTSTEQADWMDVEWSALAERVAHLIEQPQVLLIDSAAPVVITAPFTIPRSANDLKDQEPPMPGKTPSFDMIPSQTQLDEMDRRLEFFPADAAKAQRLRGEQVQAYNETGFLAPLDIFDQEETERHRAYFDDLLAQYLADGKDSYSISTAHLRHQGVYDLLVDPRIVEVVRDLLGDDVIGWGSHYFCKMPGDGKQVSWHQDAGYWPLSPSKTVTVWLAIDDSDRGNGCMRVIPGTHQLGQIPFERSGAEEDNVLKSDGDASRRLGGADRCRVGGRTDLDPQRLARAWLGRESIGSSSVRSYTALLLG